MVEIYMPGLDLTATGRSRWDCMVETAPSYDRIAGPKPLAKVVICVSSCPRITAASFRGFSSRCRPLAASSLCAIPALQ
jgi:hypothetical protein